MKIATIVFLILAGIIAGPANAQLQLAEVVSFPKQDSSRALSTPPEVDEREVSKFETPKLRLKWAIVSGNLNESVDRVRVRVRFNDEKKQWIDLYAAKNALENFDYNVVQLRESDGLRDTSIKETSNISADPSPESGSGVEGKPELPDLRIEDWDHDRLLIKFSSNDIDRFPETYFRFDLSQDLSD